MVYNNQCQWVLNNETLLCDMSVNFWENINIFINVLQPGSAALTPPISSRLSPRPELTR